jgi:hypothetical protein
LNRKTAASNFLLRDSFKTQLRDHVRAVKGDFRLISQPPHSCPLKCHLYFILSLPRLCGNITTAAAAATTTATTTTTTTTTPTTTTTTTTTTPTTTTTAAALQNAVDAAVQPSV